MDEELAAVLKVVNGIGKRRARFHRNHRAVRPTLNVALIGLVVLESVSHYSLASRGGQHVGAQPDDATRGNLELDVDAVALRVHRKHLALPTRYHVYHLRRVFLGHVDGEFLYRLASAPVYLLVNHLWLTHLQFVAFATHRLDKHAQVQHTATIHRPFILVLALRNTQRQVLLQLSIEPFLDVTRGDVLAFTSEEGRVVDGEQHTHRRLVNGNGVQSLGCFSVADGIAYLEVFQTDDGTDIAAAHALRASVRHALEGVQFLDFRLFLRAVPVNQRHRHTILECAPMDASHSDAPRVGRVVEAGDKHLRRTLQHRRRRDVLNNLVKQIGNICRWCTPISTHPSLLCRAEHYGKVQLLLRSVKGKHQVKHHFVHLVGTAVRLVNLVYHHDGLQPYLQRFLQHKPRLRHRTFESIHQQQAAVSHIQHTLHLTSEIAMSWRVNNVDFYALIDNGNVL